MFYQGTYFVLQAFLILRKYGSFIISLFAMMISTGLPELQSEKDLNYLKETLVSSNYMFLQSSLKFWASTEVEFDVMEFVSPDQTC